MQKSLIRLSGAALAIASLTACGMTPDAQRAAGGAVAGAVLAKAFDEDPRAGAVIGAGAGALCDDAGVCYRRY